LANATLGDADADRDVDGFDYLIWQRNLGMSVVLSRLTVSEPTANLLVVLAAIILAGTRPSPQ
tara:strand:+ start:386 stop:574 length:189 start_codon:yes stop_codon:yes gene_type:complete